MEKSEKLKIYNWFIHFFLNCNPVYFLCKWYILVVKPCMLVDRTSDWFTQNISRFYLQYLICKVWYNLYLLKTGFFKHVNIHVGNLFHWFMINSNTDVYEIDNSINPFCLFFSLQIQYFCNEMTTNAKIPTDIYDLVPTNEFAMESISWPLTPKSHILISPLELTRMFDGFTSEKTPPKKKKIFKLFHPCNSNINYSSL